MISNIQNDCEIAVSINKLAALEHLKNSALIVTGG